MTAGNPVLWLLNSSIILSISLTTALLGAQLFALLRVGFWETIVTTDLCKHCPFLLSTTHRVCQTELSSLSRRGADAQASTYQCGLA